MKSQQIHKYAELITKYQNRKKSRLNSSLYRNFQVSNFCQTFDSNSFKQAIQQKIRSKCRQPKTVKMSTEPSANYFHLDSLYKINSQNNKSEYRLGEEKQKGNLIRNQNVSHLKVNNLSLSHKKNTVSINTSNLLSLASPGFIKNRRQMQDSKLGSYGRLKNQVSIFREENTKKNYKNQFVKEQGFERMLKYGYQLDGSIFHFQNTKTKTLACQLQQKKAVTKSEKRQKQKIYQALKSTSPMIIAPKMLKSSFEKSRMSPNKQALSMVPHKFLRKKTYLKSSSERIQSHETYNQLKMNSLHIRKSPKILRIKKYQDLSGWQYDQEF